VQGLRERECDLSERQGAEALETDCVRCWDGILVWDDLQNESDAGLGYRGTKMAMRMMKGI